MSLPGSITQSIEDSLLGKESEPSAADKFKASVGEGMGTAAAQKANKYREIRKRVFSGRGLENPISEENVSEPELGS